MPQFPNLEPDYQIDRVIGEGGMGVVYLGIDQALHRKVAIKVLNSQTAGSDDFAQRFLLESRALAALEHPNIVGIYRAGQCSMGPYFVMQFIEGTDLGSVLDSHKTLGPTDVLYLVRQIGDALDYAHSKGFVHRDIKPGNILIDSKGTAKVTDFGIVRFTGMTRQTMTGAIIGTPEYMSPEQCDGREVTGASDLYSLGIMCYEMLSGKPPFTGSSPMSVGISHLKDPVPPVNLAKDDGLSRSIQRVLERCLAKDPANRYKSCREFSDDLENAIGGKAVSKPIKGTSGNQNKLMIGVATIFLVVAVLAIGKSMQSKAAGPPAVNGEVIAKSDPVSQMEKPTDNQVMVPNLVNKTEMEARKLLTDVNLSVKTKISESASVPDKQIISQKPSGGDLVSPGTDVIIEISSNTSAVRPPATATHQEPSDNRGERSVADTEERQAIQAMLTGWRQTWENKNADALMTYYSPAATIRKSSGKVFSYDTFHRDEIEKFSKGGAISIDISTPAMTINGTNAQIKFNNTFNRRGGDGNIHIPAREKMTLQKVDGRWIILRDESYAR